MSLRKPLQLNESVRKLCKLSECDFLFLKITLDVFYSRFNFCIFSLYYSFNQLQYYILLPHQFTNRGLLKRNSGITILYQINYKKINKNLVVTY